MKYLFISGIPTAGKSYLAERVAQKTNSLHIDIDDLREEMSKNSQDSTNRRRRDI
ncbi:MAG: AAA family ATPase [bacterium]|nr:AAA family ATPase [bacterium]